MLKIDIKVFNVVLVRFGWWIKLKCLEKTTYLWKGVGNLNIWLLSTNSFSGFALQIFYLLLTILWLITPYVRIMDFDWLIARVFFTNLLWSNEYHSFFNAAVVFAKRIYAFLTLSAVDLQLVKLYILHWYFSQIPLLNMIYLLNIV